MKICTPALNAPTMERIEESTPDELSFHAIEISSNSATESLTNNDQCSISHIQTRLEQKPEQTISTIDPPGIVRPICTYRNQTFVNDNGQMLDNKNHLPYIYIPHHCNVQINTEDLFTHSQTKFVTKRYIKNIKIASKLLLTIFGVMVVGIALILINKKINNN